MSLFPFFGRRKKLPVAEEEFYLNKAATPKTGSQNNEWVAEDYEEGQLSVDVYQTKDSLIIKSTIAGVRPEDIDIAINNDMLTIRGKREVEETVSEEDYLYQECYWGGFSRSIILPCEVQADKVEANLKNGVLTITLPKAKKAKGIQVQVTEE